jgi:hypothetical protein
MALIGNPIKILCENTGAVLQTVSIISRTSSPVFPFNVSVH